MIRPRRNVENTLVCMEILGNTKEYKMAPKNKEAYHYFAVVVLVIIVTVDRWII